MNARVLVVDDNLTVRTDLRDALAEAGFEVTACATLAEAEAALDRAPHALVVLDVILPDGDGVEFLARLKRDGGPAVMLLTTEAVVRDRLLGSATGADDYVGKPYDRAYVVARARELVHGAGAAADPRRTVLVVESSPVYGAVLRSILEEAGYAARLAGTGEEGLRTALALRPAAAIVDARLPGIDGATVVRRMRLDAALQRMPTLLLTATSDAGEELRALDAGVDAFVRKGADPGLILARLAALLRGADQGSDAPAPTRSARRVLVVDADPRFPSVLAGELRGEGYDVSIAAGAGEALELLKTLAVDCLLVDLALPGRTGLELCQELRAMPLRREMAIVLVSAVDDPATMIRCMNAGADDYVLKGAGTDVLRARVRALLRRKQYEDERRQHQEQQMREELHASQARAAWDLAEARAALLADLREKNEELHRANALLASARDQAERESSSKSRFLASMSHELRTPLNAIIGFSELLEQQLFGPLNERQAQYIAHVHASGRHLLSLINDVLDLSKIAAGRVELQREWIDAGLIAEAAVGIVRPLAEKQGVELQVQLAPELPLVYGDPIRLRQVLYNLLSNAIKFTRAGGRVRIRAWEDGDQLHLAVSDTGVGIRREDLPRLFREFEQLGADLADKPEGTGLGLALSRRLVQLHGGRIAATSERGVGSTFTVSLPRQELAEPGDARGRPLVLVVDDDPTAADLLTGHLRVAGLSVAWARSADEAFDVAADLRPAAITLDIVMPGADGWAVLDRLRTDPVTATIPVVVVSVVDDAARAFELGAADHLRKPVDRAALLRSLEAAGVEVERPLAALVVGAESRDLAQVATHLRGSGHAVVRAGTVADGDLDGVDVVVVDGAFDLSHHALRVVAARAAPPPMIVVGGAEGDPVAELAAEDPALAGRARVEVLGWPDALDAFTLGRALRAAVTRAREARRVGPRLGSRDALLAHLRASIHRAERSVRQVVVVGARMGPGFVDRAFDARAIGLRLRAGDYVAVPEPGAVVLVVEGVPQRATASVASRLGELVTTAYDVPPLDVATACWPTDAPDAGALLARLYASLSLGPEA